MERWQKILAWCLLGLLGVAVFVAVALHHQVKQTVPDCYAQWATAELIIAHQKDKQRLPANWAELQPYFKGSAPHTGGQSFDQIRARVQIDFAALPQLELDHGEGRVPEVITCVSGIGAHWAGGEPNELVYAEFRK